MCLHTSGILFILVTVMKARPKVPVESKAKSKSRKSAKTSNIAKDYTAAYNARKKAVVDYSWDFRKVNTKEYTHCFHSYPAMMIPQVARRIIQTYGEGSKVLFDPFCGTGTSLVEANLSGLTAIGTDINPLARLIAVTKTTRIDLQVLDLFLHDFVDYLFAINFQADRIKSTVIPEVKNIDYWFSKDTQKKLGIILGYIESINNLAIRNFFRVAFSETVRETSFIKAGEFKLVRTKDLSDKSELDVFGAITMRLSRNKKGLIEFMNACKKRAASHVYDFNSVFGIPSNLFKPNLVDIVLTSPPYGDSRTTVAYGQFSRLANEWLGYPKANQIDNLLMGGEKRKHHHVFKSSILNEVIRLVRNQDSNRARDVISFYEDYERAVRNIAKTVKSGGHACFVVGNRTVKGIKIPTDQITAEIFEENGFTHIETIERNIPNKRMPSRNSPSNIVGQTASTIKNEYIVICRKN